MPQPLPTPDFRRFRDTLLLKRAYARPPLFDFHVHPAHKARVLGRPVQTPADDVAFFAAAGYDYAQCTVHVPVRELEEALARARGGAASHGAEGGILDSAAAYRARRWSWQAAADGDLTVVGESLDWLRGMAAALPPTMKLLVHNGDVFTYAWELLGFSRFCMATLEDPEWVAELMNSLAAAELNATRAAVAAAGPALGALMYSDDIAYTGGLMLAPAFYRAHLFPVIAQFAALGAERDAPLIYHSDGRLYDVLDDLARAGVRGLQPLEPKAMEPEEIRRRCPGRFCLLGNIDLDLLARGAEHEVAAHVRERVARLNQQGGYMPGVSNTVPDYVRFENYTRMRQDVLAMEPRGGGTD